MLKVIASSSAGNAYGWGPLLIEAGLRARDIMRGLGYQAPAACVITHEHGDHSCGAKELRRYGIPIYASAGTLDRLGIEGITVRHGEPFSPVQGTEIVPLNSIHDAAEPLMFVVTSATAYGIRRLLFATDTAELPYEIEGLTDIAIEVNYSETGLLADEDLDIGARIRIARSHLSLETAVRWLRGADLSRCRSITLLHLSSRHGNPDDFRRIIEQQTGIPATTARSKQT